MRQDDDSPPASARPMADWTEALDLRAVAERYGTPVYLHHPATLRASFDAYAAIVGAAQIRYPVKANPSPVVVEAIARWGGGADCASRPEVTAALAAGIPFERISYTSPAPQLGLATWLLDHGGSVVADSVDMLRALDGAYGAKAPAGRVVVRVNPGGLPGYLRHAEHQRYTAHGDPRSQFGIPSEEVPGLLAETRVPVRGLHLHVGTMMDNLGAFTDALAFLHALADAVGATTPHAVDTINLGGGLGLPHDRSQAHPTIAALGAALRPLLRAGTRYEIEPGNSLVGDSFALLARMVARKPTRGRTWGICDVGTDQLVKHTVAGWRHEIVDADHRPLPADGPDALAGPLCFAGDVLLPATDIGGLRVGDPLLVRHAGAYCEAIASRFNGRLGPGTVIVEEGRVVGEARRREDAHVAAEGAFARPIRPAVAPGAATPIAPERVAALQSAYMRDGARSDRYDIVAAEPIGERTYAFAVAIDAPCGFVGLPLALRIAGDASIVAAGLVLGWARKHGSVMASHLTLTAEAALPAQGRIPCRVAVSAPFPAGEGAADSGEPLDWVASVRFELGEAGEVRGTARIHTRGPA